ncbi:hypothetical protein CYY_007995 [Polysphondylium violaceum]|uniref:Uncharacterized protein n=1 Tax=Polysphondylium violaceum TaxID=133409 RepID=A0A8J4V4G0_9MYCE|nr:hypothetical protein CYY_007995 [Polysphondylium violaceum]
MNKFYLFVFVFVFALVIDIHSAFEIDRKSQDRLSKGKESLETIQINSRNSRCWEECLEILSSSGCRGMDDIARSRLAVKLSNCHLLKSNHKTYPCTYDMSISECTMHMDQLSFVTYTNFYISTENICYYLLNEVFQQKTEDSINRLYDSTINTLESMQDLSKKTKSIESIVDESYSIQKNILNTQNNLKTNILDTIDKIEIISKSSDQIQTTIKESSEKQEDLIKLHERLHQDHQKHTKQSLDMINQIKTSSDSIISNTANSIENQSKLLNLQSMALNEISNLGQIADNSILKLRQLLSTQERLLDGNQIILSILEHINYLQHLILSEVIDFKSILFYLFISIIVYIITKHRQTKSARIPLLFGLVFVIVLEKSLTIFSNQENVQYITQSNYIPQWFKLLIENSIGNSNSGTHSFDYIFFSIDHIRKLYYLFGATTIFLSIWFYKDYEKLNHHLLLSLVESNRNLVNLLEKQQSKQKKWFKSIQSNSHINSNNSTKSITKIEFDSDI